MDGRSAGLPVVGREDEARTLDDAVDRAARGAACAVLVRGEAGIGKTTLVRDAARRAERGGATALWAPCLRFAAVESTFLPLVLALERWRPETGEDRLVAEVPGVSQLWPRLGATTAPGPMGLLPVVSAVLDIVSRSRTVLLVVDDVQWADPATRDALAYVLAGQADQHLCVVVTLRDEGLAADDPARVWWSDVRRLPAVDELVLERLTVEQTEVQVAGVLGREPDPRLAVEVHDRSGGNPYLTELLVADVGPAADSLPVGQPDALVEALLRLWRDLEPDGRRLTQLLAVAGRPVSLETLLDVLAEAGNIALSSDVVTQSIERGVVVRQGTELWFRHPLLAETLLGTVLPDEARRWHGLWAARLEGAQATGTEELRRLGALALHQEASGDLAAAVRTSLAAADLASSLRSRREEAMHLRRAARLWERAQSDGDDLPDEIGVLIRAVHTSDLVGESGGALELVERALDVVDETTDPLRASWLVRSRGDLLWALGRLDAEPIPELRRAVALSAATPGSEEHARALSALSQSLGWETDPDALPTAEAALEAARRSGTPRALAEALAARAMARGNVGDHRGALEDSVVLMEVAASVEEPDVRGWAAMWRGNELVTHGRLAEHVELLVPARGEMMAEGALSLVAVLGASLAGSLVDLGRLRQAGEVLHHDLAIGGIFNDAAMVRMNAAQLAVRAGAVETARLHLARTEELVPSYLTRPGLEAPPVVAEVLLAEGKADEALALLRRTLPAHVVDPRILDQMVVRAATAAADVAGRGRDLGLPGATNGATADLDEVLAERRRLTAPDLFEPTSFEDLVEPAWRALFDAERLRCAGSSDEPDGWRAAAQACDAAGLRWDAARSRLRLAACLLRAPRRSSAVAGLLRGVVRYAEAEGAAPLRAEALDLARIGRVPLDEPVAVPAQRVAGALAALTPREREVLGHLAAGRTYAEIADDLVISEKTVSVHVSNLLRKTGTSSRQEAAALAVRLGAEER